MPPALTLLAALSLPTVSLAEQAATAVDQEAANSDNPEKNAVDIGNKSKEAEEGEPDCEQPLRHKITLAITRAILWPENAATPFSNRYLEGCSSLP